MIEIRPLTGDDAGAMWSLRLEALEREQFAFGESAAEHRSKSIDFVRARLTQPGTFVVGAFAGSRLVGTAGFYRDQNEKERHKGHVWGVYVTEGWRRKGVARSILTEVLRLARAEPGVERISLAVSANQPSARELYRSLGFETFGCERHALKAGDVYVDEEHMVLVLR